MNRLQISLTENHYEFLKAESFETGQSMAGVLRNLIDEVIEARRQTALNDDPIWQAIGVGQELTGPTDISANTDKYLYGTSETATHLKLVAEEQHDYTTD